MLSTRQRVRATGKELAGKTIKFNLWLEQLRFAKFPATDISARLALKSALIGMSDAKIVKQWW